MKQGSGEANSSECFKAEQDNVKSEKHLNPYFQST